MTHLAHKIELSPTAAQARYFAQACGVARFAWNWGLAEWDRQYKAGLKPSQLKLRRELNSSKITEFPWMSQVTKTAPQYALMHLGQAFQRYFKKQSKRPKFKKKGIHDSFRADDGPKSPSSSAVEVRAFRVKLPRIGWIRMREMPRFVGRILSVTVSRTADRWFASFLIETEVKPIARESQASVGCDLGSRKLATLSDGTVFENPKALRSKLGKLRRLQRALSRKQKGSKRRQKAKQAVAKLHYRIACVRKDALHKLTTFLVKHFSHIGVETLNVKGMLHNRKLSKAIQDCGFGEFARQLNYKSLLYGSHVTWADRFFPSSKTCSECGCINDSLTLSDREWVCLECGTHHDRDRNAAINLRNLTAVSSTVAARGEDVRPISNAYRQSSMKRELTLQGVRNGGQMTDLTLLNVRNG